MKELKNVITTTYEMEPDWKIDIVREGNMAEAFIYENNVGVKSLMFGMDLKENGFTYDYFLEIVEANFEEYRDIYLEDYDY